MTYDQEVIAEIKKTVKPFDGLDLNDEIIVIGINATALKSLSDVQDMYAGFDGDVMFDYDPEPFLKVSWWHSMTGTGDEVIFRFNPLRVDGEMIEDDPFAAYERAMSVI